MAAKGSPRDMKKWPAALRDPNIEFPGESDEYRRARNQLVEAEAARHLRAGTRLAQHAVAVLAEQHLLADR